MKFSLPVRSVDKIQISAGNRGSITAKAKGSYMEF